MRWYYLFIEMGGGGWWWWWWKEWSMDRITHIHCRSYLQNLFPTRCGRAWVGFKPNSLRLSIHTHISTLAQCACIIGLPIIIPHPPNLLWLPPTPTVPEPPFPQTMNTALRFSHASWWLAAWRVKNNKKLVYLFLCLFPFIATPF